MLWVALAFVVVYGVSFAISVLLGDTPPTTPAV